MNMMIMTNTMGMAMAVMVTEDHERDKDGRDDDGDEDDDDKDGDNNADHRCSAADYDVEDDDVNRRQPNSFSTRLQTNAVRKLQSRQLACRPPSAGGG